MPTPLLPAMIVTRWPEIVAWIGRNPANKPLVENCRPVEVRDGYVILGFPEDQPFLREKAEQRRTHLEDNLGALDVRLSDADVEVLETAVPAARVAGDRYPPAELSRLGI